ncbi:MAG: hypothetical protein LBP22_08585 [Deltaproteobacteria bacterium]|jgi:hypothetical protein|nr:hypothetical protein [Deltaproteobacteria bacterium]
MSDWDFLYDMQEMGYSQEDIMEAMASSGVAPCDVGDAECIKEQELRTKNKENTIMKRLFLVDFENVHNGGLKGIKLLSRDDDIVLFYSESNSESIAIISELRDGIQYAKIISNGQNALDFQLSSYLGFAIKDAAINNLLAATRFYIISKDAGFDAVLNFWTKTQFIKNLNLNPFIARAANIHLALQPPKAALPKESKQAPIPSKPKNNQLRPVDELIKSAQTYSDFHSALVKSYGMPKGSELYRSNKERFKALKNL